jgi:hypothetical protein
MKVLIGFVLGWAAHQIYRWLILRKQTRAIMQRAAAFEVSYQADKKARVTE